jgi:hypothetical protein
MKPDGNIVKVRWHLSSFLDFPEVQQHIPHDWNNNPDRAGGNSFKIFRIADELNYIDFMLEPKERGSAWTLWLRRPFEEINSKQKKRLVQFAQDMNANIVQDVDLRRLER